MPEVTGHVVVTAAQAGAEPVGWVDGVPVETSALDAYLVELARSPQGTRLGLDATGGAAPGGDDQRTRAVRTWSARTLLTDRLLESEARRLGVGRPGSPDNWIDCLQAAGELEVLLPSEADAYACYQANRYRYELSEARLVRHVLVADKTSAYRLRTTLSGPSALAELAEEVSVDEGTRARGGSLGWVERGQLAGFLEQAIFDAAMGEICGPVESCFGWHLLVVEAVRAGRTRSFAECRNEIISELAGDRRRTAWREWWERRVAESITVPAGAEQILSRGLPGTSHRH